MQIQVESSSNSEGSEQFAFKALDVPRMIKAIKVSDRGQDIVCDVVAVQKGGQFAEAFAVKIADSGAGYAYLIYGSDWGIRIRPQKYSYEPWDLTNKNQWGEPFKIYGEKEDIIFKEAP